MKHNFNFVRLGLLLGVGLGVSSCTPAKPVAEAEYSAKIVGNWLDTVGNMKESITFSGGGSFIASMRGQVYFVRSRDAARAHHSLSKSSATLAAHRDKGSRGALVVVLSRNPALGAHARSDMDFIDCAVV